MMIAVAPGRPVSDQLPFLRIALFFDVQFFHIAAHAISRRHVGNVFRTYRPLKVDIRFEALRAISAMETSLAARL